MEKLKKPLFGVDMSVYQRGISFDALKAAGVEFIILRAGHGSGKDSEFDNFYAKAQQYNIPVGAYWYLTSTTVDSARKAANEVTDYLSGKDIKLPVYLDVEMASLLKLGKRTLTDIILAFTNIIENSGYTAGIYLTEEWLYNYVYTEELTHLEKWIAKWSAYRPATDCGMWQFGGEKNYIRSNKIGGVLIDQDYMYYNYLEDNMTIYKYLKDVPEGLRKELQTIVDHGSLKGEGGTGEDIIINMSYQDIRMQVVAAREAKYLAAHRQIVKPTKPKKED